MQERHEKDVQSKLHNCYNGIVRIFTAGNQQLLSFTSSPFDLLFQISNVLVIKQNILKTSIKKDNKGQQVLDM